MRFYVRFRLALKTDVKLGLISGLDPIHVQLRWLRQTLKRTWVVVFLAVLLLLVDGPYVWWGLANRALADLQMGRASSSSAPTKKKKVLRSMAEVRRFLAAEE